MSNDGGKLKSILSALAFAAAIFVFGANSALAVTNLAGYPSGANGVMSLANSPYVVTADILVPTGQTLTIEPGVIVKMQSGRSIVLLNGNIVIGSEDNPNPVVITSYKDDAYGGDTNGDGPTSPEPGDWKYIQVSSAASSLTANNVVIRYGGLISSMVQVLSGAHATIVNATIEYSNDAGLGIRNGDTSLTLTDSIIRNNYEGLTISFQADVTVTGTTFSGNRRGLAIDTDADTANLSISNNTFSGNNWAVGSYTPAGLDFADTNDTLIAINNDWGSTSGPTIASNPSGAGDRIIGNVTYSPWTGQNQGPTLSYVGTSGYTTDGVEPNISFRTQNAPAFKVLYSDPESVPASYMRLIVASTTYAMATGTGGAYEFSAATSTFAKASYNYHFEASDGTNTTRLPASGELSFEVRNTPVLLVPGIMGTEMWKETDLVWPDTTEMLRNFGDEFMSVLAMNTDGTFTDNQITLGGIVRSAPTKDIFAGLITEFTAKGYQENTDLFVFPYDWRIDIQTAGQGLKIKIDNVKSQTGSNKIDVVAHSMGGLLSKQYILDNGSSAINKLIFVGTPHLGAPKAAKTLLLGDDLGIRLLFLGLSDSIVQIISQNMPAIYQLLPSYEYFSQIGNYYSELNGVNYDYARMRQYLIDSGLNLTLINQAYDFHSTSMDNFDATNIDAYNITGCTTPTISLITKRSDMNNEYTMQMSAGDGTVPFGSSKAVSITAGKSYYFKNYGFLSSLFPRIDHAELPSASGIKELITNIITGSNIFLPSYATQNPLECKLEGEIVSSHSPVNLHVYDQNGNHVGRGENSEIEYEISGVAYEEIGENKFVFLPTSGGQTYQVTLDGTGSGTFSLRVSKVENNEITETAYYSNLPVSTATEATVTLAADVSNTILSVDQNGTGNFTTAPVSAVLNSTQAADVTKPSSAISISGNNTSTDRYQTSATISLSSTDDNAGILKTEYSLDSGSTWNTYSNSFIITTLGSNTIQYRATDRVGNVESTKSKTIEIMAAPNAVIIVPQSNSASSPSSTNTPKQIFNTEPTPKVLGEERERPINEHYTTEQILDALATADTNTLLDYLGKVRDTVLEAKVAVDYGKYLVLDKPAINFITYGTKSTEKLGTGERAGVLRSYQYAFGKLPQTLEDWQDAVNIATGQLPNRRNAKTEKESWDVAKKIYRNIDEQSVMKITYGLRPEVRNIKKERAGLRRFGRIFGRMPSTVLDWNIFRKLVY